MNQELNIALAYLGGQAIRLGFGWAVNSIGAKKLLPFDGEQLRSIAMAALGSPAAPAIMQNAPILAQLSPEGQIVVALGAGAIAQAFSRDADKASKIKTTTKTETVTTEKVTPEATDTVVKKTSTSHRINDRDDLP